MTIMNAVIRDTYMGLAGDTYFTFRIYLDYYKGINQLREKGIIRFDLHEEDNGNMMNERPLHKLSDMLKLVGVSSWEELKGEYIRIEVDKDFDKITGIGNILNEDKWIDFNKWK